MPPKAAQLKAANEVRAMIAETLQASDGTARHAATVEIVKLLQAERDVDDAVDVAASTDDLLLQAGNLLQKGDRAKSVRDIGTLLRGLAPDAREASEARSAMKERRTPSPQPNPRPQREKAVLGVKELVHELDQVSDAAEAEKPRKRQKCAGCGQTRAGCICRPDPPKPRQAVCLSVKKSPSATVEEEQEDGTSSDEESEASEEVEESEEEELHENADALDVDSPGVFLDAEQWPQLFKQAAVADIRRNIVTFYDAAFASKDTKNDAEALVAMLLLQGQLLKRSQLHSRTKFLSVKTVDRGISRHLNLLKAYPGSLVKKAGSIALDIVRKWRTKRGYPLAPNYALQLLSALNQAASIMSPIFYNQDGDKNGEAKLQVVDGVAGYSALNSRCAPDTGRPVPCH